MIETLSLRSRIVLLLAAILAVGLAIGIATLILHAGARIRTEAGAATHLAEDFVENALARAAAAPDPDAELKRLLAQAQKLRHVRIFLEGEPAPSKGPAGIRRAPAWFAALATPRENITRITAPQPSSLSDLSAYYILSFALKLCVGSQRCEGTGDEQLPAG